MNLGWKSKTRIEIRLVGEGGQGVILAGIILAEAAAIYDGLQVVQSQSYGPEARGGASKSEVIISDQEIDFPEVIHADLVIALSQEACDKYGQSLKDDGLLIVDTTQVTRVQAINAVKVPITRIALDTTARAITARGSPNLPSSSWRSQVGPKSRCSKALPRARWITRPWYRRSSVPVQRR